MRLETIAAAQGGIRATALTEVRLCGWRQPTTRERRRKLKTLQTGTTYKKLRIHRRADRRQNIFYCCALTRVIPRTGGKHQDLTLSKRDSDKERQAVAGATKNLSKQHTLRLYDCCATATTSGYHTATGTFHNSNSDPSHHL